MGHHPEEVKKHIRSYLAVFAALAVLTVVTVAVSYLHLSVTQGIAVALFIASVKASLVACVFMHLLTERKAIFSILGLTFFFLLIILIIPSLHF